MVAIVFGFSKDNAIQPFLSARISFFLAVRNGLNDLEYFGAKWDLSEYYSEDRLEKQSTF